VRSGVSQPQCKRAGRRHPTTARPRVAAYAGTKRSTRDPATLQLAERWSDARGCRQRFRGRL